MTFPAELSADEIRKLFRPQTEPPADDVFEVGLVLGGTVSAGCFTAGVLDFMIEALDCWTIAKAEERKANQSGAAVPNHRVQINVISGASGGGVNGAVFAKVIRHAFPPYRGEADDDGRQNPLSDLWVNRFDVAGFTDNGDLDGEQIQSVLNPGPIDRGVEMLAGYEGKKLGTLSTPEVRDYVPDKLTLFLTLTNLRGVPYQIKLGSEQRSQSFVDHADFVRFGIATRDVAFTPRPDEFGVRDGCVGAPFISWAEVGAFGRATGAFPIGFPARSLERPVLHYRYRVFADAGKNEVKPLTPDWDCLSHDGTLPDTYRFVAVDGGATNNQPVELARTFLAGHLGRNPRDGTRANRCVVLIDPFADAAQLGPETFDGPLSTVGPLLRMWLDQARFSTADISLASDQDTFSRFMITPYRREGTEDHLGGRAIASAGLGAFMGFMQREYRHHDFLLGRKVCQDFLREEFTLKKENKLFAQWRDRGYAGQHANSKGELRIIPLVGSANVDVQAPAWPSKVLGYERVEQMLQVRLKKLLPLATQRIAKSPFWGAVIAGAAWALWGRQTLASIANTVKDEAKRWGLI